MEALGVSSGGPAKNNPEVTTLENEEAKEPRPEKLYRGFVIDPQTLTLDTFKKTLTPSATSGEDGNEAGVYMTDNLAMVESTNYSSQAKGGVEVPMYDSGYGRTNNIQLSGCGVILEIETKDIPVREPKIHPTWDGHYNNGFVGKEWIANEISAEKYKVKKLILGKGATDMGRKIFELKDGSDEELIETIEKIKILFEQEKAEAEEFGKFLSTIPESSRMNKFSWERKWDKYKQEKMSLETTAVGSYKLGPSIPQNETLAESPEFTASKNAREHVSNLVAHFHQLAESALENNKDGLKTISKSDFASILSRKTNLPGLTGSSSKILLSLQAKIDFALENNPASAKIVEGLLNEYNKSLKAIPKEKYLGGDTSIDKKIAIYKAFSELASGPGIKEAASLYRRLTD